MRCKWRGVEPCARRAAGLVALIAACSRAGAADAAWIDRARRGATDVARRRRCASPAQRDVDAALRRRRDRRGAALGRRIRRRTTSSCAPPARCPASCTSSGARRVPGGYHIEYGYSCMGYEIAGGLGVKMAQPGPRSDRHGRRRQLPDAQLRDRDVGHARPQARHRRARQPRLRLHQPPAAGGRRRAVQQPARRLRAGRRRRAAHRLRGARARRWARSPRTSKTIAELEAALARARAADRTYVICIDTDPAHTTERRRLVVGSGGAGGVGARGSAQGAREAIRAASAATARDRPQHPTRDWK